MKYLDLKGKYLELYETVETLNKTVEETCHTVASFDWSNWEHQVAIDELKQKNARLLADRTDLENIVSQHWVEITELKKMIERALADRADLENRVSRMEAEHLKWS